MKKLLKNRNGNRNRAMLRHPGEILKDQKGMSQTVEIVGIIIIVLVLLIVVFFPQIKAFFTNTIMPALSQKVTDIINLT